MVTTVRVTRRLLETLSGVPTTSREPEKREARGLSAARESETRYPAITQSSLRDTVRYGNLLLQHEGGELGRVAQYAEDLIKSEYEAPLKPVPCQGEKEACFSCYKENKEDPTACAKVVREYHRCSQSAA